MTATTPPTSDVVVTRDYDFDAKMLSLEHTRGTLSLSRGGA